MCKSKKISNRLAALENLDDDDDDGLGNILELKASATEVSR
jgi:hypothetical protein